jgi:hypothetical protein
MIKEELPTLALKMCLSLPTAIPDLCNQYGKYLYRFYKLSIILQGFYYFDFI